MEITWQQLQARLKEEFKTSLAAVNIDGISIAPGDDKVQLKTADDFANYRALHPINTSKPFAFAVLTGTYISILLLCFVL
jgi:hypothetical protein